MNYNAAYVGGYRTRSFSEIYPDFATFQTAYKKGAFPDMLLTGTGYTNFGLSTIYALLMARYFESHISTDSEDAFELQLMSRIFQHGQAWQKEMYLQQKLIGMTDADILDGGKIVYNHAADNGHARRADVYKRSERDEIQKVRPGRMGTGHSRD